jgi:hypothetical protein
LKMARRPVFVPVPELRTLYEEVYVEFKWFSGFAETQKKKNARALHQAAARRGLSPLLEISTKSDVELGRRLSAFSLKINTEIGKISLEAAYQGSKVFERGGPFRDLYMLEPRVAKKDRRIRNSGRLIRFDFIGEEWPTQPKTAFYDWLYLKALQPYSDFLDRLSQYRGFTDIEFNPQKQVNCQARACAILVSLLRLEALDESLSTKQAFLGTMERRRMGNPTTEEGSQGRLPL